MARALLFPVMPVVPPTTAAWLPAYLAGRDAILLARVRLGSIVVLPITVGITLCNVWMGAPDQAMRFWLMFPFFVLSALGVTVGRIRSVRAWAYWIALAYIVFLTLSASATWRAFPDDAALVPVYVSTLMTASVLLFPFGVAAQGVVCATGLGAYVWAMHGIATRLDGSALIVLTGMVPVMLVGAAVFERNQRATFERTWQKEQLASLARALAEHVDPSEVIRTVLDHGLPLLGADWVAAALYDPVAGTHRVVASAGDDVPPTADLDSVLATDTRGTVPDRALPDDDPANPGGPQLRAWRVRQMLCAELRHHGEPLGTLLFARVEKLRARRAPFSSTDRTLARGLADQASLALRTARLVTDLRQANQLKVEFVSTMSHELRTPLNVILGYAEMARELGDSGAAFSLPDCLGRIEDAGRDLLELIESTLEIGRLESQRDTVELEPVTLTTFWAETHAACARIPRRAAVALEWSESPPGLLIATDPRKLRIVLRNLVGNACKFTERGYIRVTAWVENEALWLRVTDTGIGIRPEDREAVFEMFRQADGSDSRRYGGTGLGLYIVRRFVEQLGGEVTLESTVGEGSRFTVGLPLAMPASAAA